MFRLEPNAEFRCREEMRPDPSHRGISFVQRTYFLAPGTGPEVELSPGFGEAIAAGRSNRPQPMGRARDRYWWVFEDRVYSTPDRLTRAAVLRLAQREASDLSPRAYQGAGKLVPGAGLLI
jgi:hypothetical protein